MASMNCTADLEEISCASDANAFEKETVRLQTLELPDLTGPATASILGPANALHTATMNMCECIRSFQRAADASTSILEDRHFVEATKVTARSPRLQRNRTAEELIAEVKVMNEEKKKRDREHKNLEAVLALRLPILLGDRPVSVFGYKRLQSSATDLKHAIEAYITAFDGVFGTAGLTRLQEEERAAARNYMAKKVVRPGVCTLYALHRYVWGVYSSLLWCRLFLFPLGAFPLSEAATKTGLKHKPPKTSGVFLPDEPASQSNDATKLDGTFTLRMAPQEQQKGPSSVDMSSQLAVVVMNSKTQGSRGAQPLPPTNTNCTVSLWADSAREALKAWDSLLAVTSRHMGDITRFKSLWAEQQPARKPRFAAAKKERKVEDRKGPIRTLSSSSVTASDSVPKSAGVAAEEEAKRQAEAEYVIARQTDTQEAFQLAQLLRNKVPVFKPGRTMDDVDETRVEQVIGVTMAELGWR
ncbi:hypothetical protein J8273_8015 [Carpediemonas membranifera]|uniref:Uncharacterized protein n=1 Tax=Carpediemonas membranifera TaxID=201153 RepID=A0A8J6ARU0_9EUKA|nr:hypothetical protein J8273_8015 [Carpediemonas membranifera]|eukprot:KAG9390650.1 hypothetical protein J8273_8015 [Carpediemonas membranifera]